MWQNTEKPKCPLMDKWIKKYGAKVVVIVLVLSHVQVFVTVWTLACQISLSMGFPRQGYCSGLPFPFPGDSPYPGINSTSPAWQVDSLPPSHLGSLVYMYSRILFSLKKEGNPVLFYNMNEPERH